MHHIPSKRLYLLIFLLLCGLLIACDGDWTFFASYNGSRSSGTPGGNQSAQGGTFGVVVTDGPADAYAHIWLWIDAVMLIPPQGVNPRPPVEIFKSPSPEGYRIDLLALRDRDHLLTMNSNIQVGFYDRLRIIFADVQGQGTSYDSQSPELWLTQNIIDIQIPNGIRVKPNEMTMMKLDIDAEKSLGFYAQSPNGMNHFRPVIFSQKITPQTITDDDDKGCRRLLKGVIRQPVRGFWKLNTEEFILDLESGRGRITVAISDETLILDDAGRPSGRETLTKGQSTVVYGQLTDHGSLIASHILVGNIVVTRGICHWSNQIDGQLDFEPDAYLPLSGKRPELNFTNTTMITDNCGQAMDVSAIHHGQKAAAIGAYHAQDGIFNAMLLILDPLKKTGQLTRLHDYFSGKRASIQSSTQHQEDLFVPDETHAQIEGVTQLQQDLVDAVTRCQNPDVELIMAPDEAYYPIARTLRIKPNKITGRVDIIYPFNRILILDNQSVFVDPRARIIDHHGSADTVVTWNRIATGDKLICYGLKTCSSAEYDFHAMTILIKK